MLHWWHVMSKKQNMFPSFRFAKTTPSAIQKMTAIQKVKTLEIFKEYLNKNLLKVVELIEKHKNKAINSKIKNEVILHLNFLNQSQPNYKIIDTFLIYCQNNLKEEDKPPQLVDKAIYHVKRAEEYSKKDIEQYFINVAVETTFAISVMGKFLMETLGSEAYNNTIFTIPTFIAESTMTIH